MLRLPEITTTTTSTQKKNITAEKTQSNLLEDALLTKTHRNTTTTTTKIPTPPPQPITACRNDFPMPTSVTSLAPTKTLQNENSVVGEVTMAPTTSDVEVVVTEEVEVVAEIDEVDDAELMRVVMNDVVRMQERDDVDMCYDDEEQPKVEQEDGGGVGDHAQVSVVFDVRIDI